MMMRGKNHGGLNLIKGMLSKFQLTNHKLQAKVDEPVILKRFKHRGREQTPTTLPHLIAQAITSNSRNQDPLGRSA